MEKINQLLEDCNDDNVEAEVISIVKKLNLHPIDVLAVAAGVFEHRRRRKERQQKMKANATDTDHGDKDDGDEDDDGDDSDDYEAAMLKHERRLKRKRSSVSNPLSKPIVIGTPLPLLKQGKPGILEIQNSSVPNCLSNSPKNKGCTDDGVPSTSSLSKQEKLLKKPITIDETSLPLPLLKQKQGNSDREGHSAFANCSSYLPIKKRITDKGIVFSEPTYKEERLRKDKSPVIDHGASPSMPIQAKKAAKKNSKKSKKKKRNTRTEPESPPELPIETRNKITAMRGTDLKLIIQKQLYKSDWLKEEGRLLIPMNQIRATDFLTHEEKAKLCTKQDNAHKSEILVELLDPNGVWQKPSLRRWEMKSNPVLVLVTQWNKIVLDNQLGIDDIIQLWSFRVGTKLYFALVKVEDKGNNNSSGGRNGDNEGYEGESSEIGSSSSSSGDADIQI